MNPETEPLTPEERALADALARVASRAAPSAALDDRILAAARAAAVTPAEGAAAAANAPPTDATPIAATSSMAGGSQRSGAPNRSMGHGAAQTGPRARRRRPGWMAPLGLAASLVLAVGVAWQLRDLPPTAPADGSAPMANTAELAPLAMPEPAPAASTAAAQAAPGVDAEAQGAGAEGAWTDAAKPSAAPAPSKALPLPTGRPPEPSLATEDAVAPPAAPPPAAPPPPPPREANEVAAPAAMASAPPPSLESVVQEKAEAQAKRAAYRDASAAQTAKRAPIARQGAASDVARARAADRPTDAYSAPVAAPVAAASAVAQAAPAAPEQRAPAAAPASTGLDRIQVTGSRISQPATWAADALADEATDAVLATPAAQAKLDADMRLKPEAWLRRIRARAASGDTTLARASLARFVLAHPDHALPQDLGALLEP